MRTSRFTASLLALLLPPLTVVTAQTTACSATRDTASTYRGACTREGVRVASLTLQKSAVGPDGVWRGSILHAPDSLPVVIDARIDGALQLGRQWLALSEVSADSVTIRFRFSEGAPKAPSKADVDILRRARSYLDSVPRWNRADSTDMDGAPVKGFSCAPAFKQSLFCALYLASIDVVGDYAHFRPAVNAVRTALEEVSKKDYRHPLVDFNNDPATKLADVWRTLDRALDLLEVKGTKSLIETSGLSRRGPVSNREHR